MKISEILEGLTTLQNRATMTHSDVRDICKLSKELAIHIQQLEIDMRKVSRLIPAYGSKQGETTFDHAGQEFNIPEQRSRFDNEDDQKIREEVIQAARWYVNESGTAEKSTALKGYQRLRASVIAYNSTIGKGELLKEKA